MLPFGALILGIVEGITEFLPVSSTGHQILVSALLGIPQTEFVKTFEIAIQVGAILAVVIIYWRSFLNIELLKKLFVAFLPTGVIGLALYHVLKTYLIGNEVVVLAALFLGGIALIVFEKYHAESVNGPVNPREITYKNAFLIGLAQAVSIIPGVSRSAATIVGGLAVGLPRALVVEFSFLLAVPTMVAATGLDLVKFGFTFTGSEWGLLAIGFVSAFVVGFVSVRWFLTYIRSHTFSAFGIYRIIVSILFALYLFA